MAKKDEKKANECLKSLLEVLDRFGSNCDRIFRLVEVPAEFVGKDCKGLSPPEGFKTWISDIFRASIVFLHASFEDALREIARLRLSECPVEILDDIPLVGISTTGQAKKFGLGELSKHRGKTIDNLVQESVNEFLDKTSFSDCSDVSNILQEKMEIDLSRVRKYFSILDQMMKRRHQIVHRADQEQISGKWRLAPMDGQDVVKWIRNTVAFIFEVAILALTPELYKLVIKHPEFKETRDKLAKMAGKNERAA